MNKKKTASDNASFLQSVQRVLSGMPGHAYCKDVNGVYIACNNGQAKTLGFPSGESVIGKTDFDLSWCEQAPALQENDQYVMTTGKTFRAEEMATLQDGSKAIYLSHKVPFRDPAGNIIGILGMSFNISTLAVPDALEASEDVSSDQYKKARVLLVEDNRIAQLTIMMTLRDLGCYAVVVGTGAEAISAFKEGDFNLVYMDIGLPDMAGYDIVKAFRSHEAGAGQAPASIVMLTAHADETIERACIESGADGILTKPLSRLQSRQVLDKCVLKKAVNIQGFQDRGTFPGAPNTQLPVFDVEGTCASVGIKVELVYELLDVLVETLPECQLQFSTLLDSKQYSALMQEIHKFHGGLHYAGVPRLQGAASALELALVSREYGNVTALLGTLNIEIMAVLSEYKKRMDS